METLKTEPAVPLDSKEIRGVTIRQIVWLFGFLGTILISVVTTYASINNKLEKYHEDIQDIKSSKEVQQAQIEAIKAQLHAVEIKLVQLESQIKTNN